MKWNSVESHSWVQMTEIPQNVPCTYKPDNARTITISTLSLVRFSPGAAFIPANKGNRLINFYLIINKSNKCLISFSPGRNLENRGHCTCICIQCMYVSQMILCFYGLFVQKKLLCRQLLYLIPIGGESNIEVIQTRIWSIEF